MKILGIGNALVDILIQIENDTELQTLNLPKGSMQLVDADRSQAIMDYYSGKNKAMAAGGSAANTINGLASLGATTGFIGLLGKDETGEFFVNDLKSKSIQPLVQYSDTPSGKALALISPDSERTFGTYLGAAMELSAEHLKAEMFKGYDLLHIEGYLVQNHDLMRKAIELARAEDLKISIDLASYNVVEDHLEFLKEIMANGIDLVFANEEEAKAFTGLEPNEAIDQLASLCEIAVLKVGKKGSMIKSGDQFVKVDAEPIDQVHDTTGAGDLYASGFLYGMSHNLNLEQCARLASQCAAKVIRVIGAKVPDEDWLSIRKTLI